MRFLVGEGWLAHYLNFSNERMLPPMPKLLDAPFWLDPSDPHRMRSAIQLLSQPRSYDYAAASGDWQHAKSLPWSEEGGGSLAGSRPPRRGRGHQPRAGGRRGDRPHQADPERVAVPGVLRAQAAVTMMRAAGRERAFFRITISTSRSSAVRKVMSRSTENPASL